MHAVLGDSDRAAHWQSKAKRVGARINAAMWSARSQFYHDLQLPARLVSAKTAAGFWPLLAGICPAERIAALVAQLQDARTFNRPLPVPTLSADDPNYTEAGHYWVGGVWAPTNYMITRGLMLAGEGDVAHEIAKKYVSGLCETWHTVEPHTLWESYSPETPAPGRRPYSDELVKPDFCGWSAIGPIAMLIENIIGIAPSMDARRVDWEIRLTCAHGVEQLWLGDTCLQLLAADRAAPDAAVTVEARSSQPLTLYLHCRGRAATVELPADSMVTTTV
jgi:glycogen debranching enzyme